ncbi:uncharacterized protein JCM6883_003271 [Sporobolomyces salmoneus]|uniref:uncharacterized protein n=1 Tax=Sporobolomyces salmoneus TaxID=183962 RepID=UPI0031816639
MLAAFVPNEVLLDIVSHFTLGKTQVSTEAGKSVSLVCQAWLPVGQVLRWGTVGITTAKVTSLLSHFTEHPHLAKLVRRLYINFHAGERSEDMNERAFATLPLLLSKCVNLKVLDICGQMGRYLLPSLKAISQFPDLTHLMFVYLGDVAWTYEMATLFDSGFRSLTHLVFDGYFLNLRVLGVNRSRSKKIQLEDLSLFWKNEPYYGPDIVDLAGRFLSHFDPNTMRTGYFREAAVTQDAFEWFSACPNLVKFELFLTQTQSYTFDKLLAVLPRFRSLKTFIVKIFMDEDCWDLALESPVPLPVVLSSFPPNLRAFEARELSFFGAQKSIPVRRLESSEVPRARRLLATCLDDRDEGVKEMEIWTDETGPNAQWYRNVEENESE